MRRKIHLLTTVWLMLITIIINVSIYIIFANMTTKESLARIHAKAEQITEAVHPLPSSTSEEQAATGDVLRAFLPVNGMIRLIQNNEKSALTITKEPEYTQLPLLYETREHTQLHKVNGNMYAVAYFPIIWQDGSVVALEVSESMDTAKHNLYVLRWVLLTAALIVLIPSLLAGRWLSTLMLRPIHTMISTMQEIQRKQIFKKLELKQHSNDEIYKLGITFNTMMEQLENNFTKQQQFIADASHELKTPLTVIESYAKMLKRWGKNDPEVLDESVEAIYSEALRMREMTLQMLDLARHDQDWNLDVTDVDVLQLVDETTRLTSAGFQRVIRSVCSTDVVIVQADSEKLKQAMYILLQNAIAYSSSDIEVRVGTIRNNTFIAVADTGIGIPDSELPHIFDRFYRVDKARGRNSGGTGLGLAIAKRIVDLHGGSIEVDSKEGEYSCFTILLPRSEV
ncbi:HAMP domain-containing histidine kinase [Paenibacillus sp. ACRRX]|uniref:sensor histidine kinase n=1 Tax=Paenibacillus sp. ACRRX TaxID=2918206 RepID=UPI001EF42D42|nr:HAMP domain-containing sensor histidine kinase [Paenibacillus sp. ACRRX]MCG7407765.1 HAMP domain-containing histidine kinase [Paenibacillus sp. ACRRX]